MMLARHLISIRMQTPVVVLIALTACAAQPSRVAERDAQFGVLVMAHGGSSEWDEAVLEAVEPLRSAYPLEVAFGMADAASLQAGVERLEAQGVRRIGVVRLFVSGESFLTRTQQIFGLREGAPDKSPHEDQDAAHEGHGMALWKVDSRSSFALSMEGLDAAPEMSEVLLDRAKTLSRNAPQEDVLILAHGPGDDLENERWLDHMDRQADRIRNELPFARVAVATLREDWPEKRGPAEDLVRGFVRTSLDQGRTVIVLPFRVHGFGPYARVLEGMDYIADERGLLPHEAVTRWIARQAETLRREGFSAARSHGHDFATKTRADRPLRSNSTSRCARSDRDRTTTVDQRRFPCD